VAEIAGATCATTAAGLEGEVPLGFEQLLALDPDVIVVDSYRADARAREIVVEPAIDRDPRLRSLRAVRTRRLLSIPSAHLLATNHHVAALAEDLAAALAANAIEVR
jgi:ABC-type Fe3+-hydroxamate transport system substrate-binding protein